MIAESRIIEAGPKDTTALAYNERYMKDFNEFPDQEKERIKKYCPFLYRVEKKAQRRKWG